MSSGALDVVATAAPGIKDILLLGKVKQLEREGVADLIVLDAPAAGHAITFLQSARSLLDTVSVGPINAQARDVLELLEDHRRCQVVLVTIPEETPVNEAVETAFSLEDRVGIGLGPIVVNGVYPAGRRARRRRAAVAAAAADADVALRPGRGRGAGRGRPLPPRPHGAAGRAGGAARGAAPAAPAAPAVPVHRRDRPAELDELARALLGRDRGPGGAAAMTAPAAGPAAGPVLRRPAALADLVAERSIVVCCGSGGVGKTTTAAVVALEGARLGRKTVVVTIDPAKRLADALGLQGLTDTPSRIDGDWPGELWATMLDTKSTFDALVVKYAATPEQGERILANRFYRNISGALSGTQEYMAMEKLYELHDETDFDLVVVDTPPTRHALDFLDAPRRLSRFLDHRLFRLLIAPSRGIVKAVNVAAQTFLRTVSRVVGGEVVDDAMAFFQAFEGMEEGFRQRAARVNELLAADGTAFVLVASPRRDTVEEAHFFADRLGEAGIAVRGLVVNRVHPSFAVGCGGRGRCRGPEAGRSTAGSRRRSPRATARRAETLAGTADRRALPQPRRLPGGRQPRARPPGGPGRRRGAGAGGVGAVPAHRRARPRRHGRGGRPRVLAARLSTRLAGGRAYSRRSRRPRRRGRRPPTRRSR